MPGNGSSPPCRRPGPRRAPPIIRSARRTIWCAAAALVALAPSFAACASKRGCLLLRVGPLPPAALLVGRAGVQIAMPAHVVDVQFAPDGVEEPDLVDHRREQVDIVGDDHQATAEPLEEVAQPDDGVGVQVVGRLVQQQLNAGGRTVAGAVGGREQDPWPARPGAAGRRTGCAWSAPAPGREDRGWSRSGRPRIRPRTRRARRNAPRSGRSGSPPGRGPALRRVRPSGCAPSPVPQPATSRPRAESTRSLAVTSRSPSRGSCGR